MSAIIHELHARFYVSAAEITCAKNKRNNKQEGFAQKMSKSTQTKQKNYIFTQKYWFG